MTYCYILEGTEQKGVNTLFLACAVWIESLRGRGFHAWKLVLEIVALRRHKAHQCEYTDDYSKQHLQASKSLSFLIHMHTLLSCLYGVSSYFFCIFILKPLLSLNQAFSLLMIKATMHVGTLFSIPITYRKCSFYSNYYTDHKYRRLKRKTILKVQHFSPPMLHSFFKLLDIVVSCMWI